MTELKIVRGPYSQYGNGSVYALVLNGEAITTHFCSNDCYAHGDLFRHDETKKVIGSMSLEEFNKIPVYDHE